jgi:chromosome segregation ATPase
VIDGRTADFLDERFPMIDLFGVSLSSTVLFVLAGILIGHLLWYRDSSAEAEKMTGLENRYFKARGSVRQRKREFTKLQKDSDIQHTDLEQIRQQQAALLKQKSDIEQEHRDARAEVQRLAGEKQELDALLTAEQARSESVVAQLQEVLQARSSSEHELETRSDSFEQLQASHQQTIVTLETEVDQLRASASQQAETLSQTQQDLVGRCQDLDTIRSEQDAASDQLAHASTRIQDLESQLADAKLAASQHEGLANDLESAASSLAEQRETIGIRETELSQLKQAHTQLQHDRAQMGEELVSVQQQLGDVTRQAQEYKESLEQHDSKHQALLDEQERTRAQIERDQTELSGLRETGQEMIETIAQQKAELDQFQGSAGELERTRAQIEQDQTELSGLRATGQEMVETIAQQKAELIRLQSEVGELESVREQTEEISKEFVTVSNQRDDLEKSRRRLSNGLMSWRVNCWPNRPKRMK